MRTTENYEKFINYGKIWYANYKKYVINMKMHGVYHVHHCTARRGCSGRSPCLLYAAGHVQHGGLACGLLHLRQTKIIKAVERSLTLVVARDLPCVMASPSARCRAVTASEGDSVASCPKSGLTKSEAIASNVAWPRVAIASTAFKPDELPKLLLLF